MFFFLGLIIGSFLNVMIYRLPRGESLLGPRSHCPVCEHPLSIIDLIPLLGYLFRRGRCAYCSEPISLRYPLVELLTAILFVNIHWYFAWTVHTLAGLIFTSILLVAAFTDIETGIIPDFITYPALVAGLVLSCFTIGFQDSFVGALILGGVFLIVALISRGGMGGGDIKLGAVIGAFVGIPGVLLVFVISSLLGGIWALALLTSRKAGRKSAIKFGPFLALAAWMVWMYQEELISLYLLY
jgi:leader peptidase (prepilin peptidase)/N-methyltransferase